MENAEKYRHLKMRVLYWSSELIVLLDAWGSDTGQKAFADSSILFFMGNRSWFFVKKVPVDKRLQHKALRIKEFTIALYFSKWFLIHNLLWFYKIRFFSLLLAIMFFQDIRWRKRLITLWALCGSPNSNAIKG